jgi:outer membrane protein assembly factor BamB
MGTEPRPCGAVPWTGRRGAINAWTDERRPRGIEGDRSADGEAEVGVPDLRRVGRRGADDGVEPALHRQRRGVLYALDATNGLALWKAMLGGDVAAGPMTYLAGGKQYIAIVAGCSVCVWA